MQPTAPSLTVAADGHLHVYPGRDVRLLFESLSRNLKRAAAAASAGNPDLILAFLAESAGCHEWERLRRRDPDLPGLGLEIRDGPGPVCLTVSLAGAEPFWLVAGRQIVTRERLEILGLAMRAALPDGLPARETIRRVIEAGGIPVLAWSPGKWLFARGRRVRALLDGELEPALRIGDSALRPACWPEPRLMRRARSRGRPMIPGSDPLPLAGEERAAGRYGFAYRGPFDPAHPAVSIAALLSGPDATRMPIGARDSLLAVARRLFRLRLVRRQSEKRHGHSSCP